MAMAMRLSQQAIARAQQQYNEHSSKMAAMGAKWF